jgi:N-acetylglucosamine kinase-like BadF-type ATPase
MNKPKQILVADAGGTKTAWLYVNTATQEQKRFTSLGIHPLFLSARQIENILLREVAPQFASFPETDLQIFFYGAGCEASDRQGIIHQGIQTAFPDADINVASDLLGAVKSLCGKEAGVGCILGTGSNSAAYDGTQITQQQISLGFWLGDEGSGGYMGKELLTDALRKKLPADLQEKFEATHRLDLALTLKRMYQEPTPNQYAASFTSFLRLNRGHEYVEALLDRSFSLFIELELLNINNIESLPIHCTGGVATTFADAWQRNLKKYNLIVGTISDDILPALARYHQDQ